MPDQGKLPRRTRVVLLRAPRREMSAKPTPQKRKSPLGEPARPRQWSD